MLDVKASWAVVARVILVMVLVGVRNLVLGGVEYLEGRKVRKESRENNENKSSSTPLPPRLTVSSGLA